MERVWKIRNLPEMKDRFNKNGFVFWQETPHGKFCLKTVFLGKEGASNFDDLIDVERLESSQLVSVFSILANSKGIAWVCPPSQSHQDYCIPFRLGDPNLNLHLPQASWEGATPKV